MDTPVTIYGAFCATARRFPGRCALRFKVNGIYQDLSYADLDARVNCIASHLSALGIGRGDTVGIFAANCPEWAQVDLAVLKLGGIVVPIYPTTPPATLEYILRDSDIRLLVVSNATTYAAAATVRNGYGSLHTIVVLDPTGLSREEALPFASLTESPRDVRDVQVDGTDDGIATIVYTSGTSGEPKGVMLSHANILSNVRAVITRFKVTPDDVTVSYLPLCHMFERTCGYYAVLLSGATIAYAESLATVAADVAQIHPTVMIAVPRVLEKAFEEAVSKVERKSPLRRRLVAAAMYHLNCRSDARYRHQRFPFLMALKCIILDRLVASKFRKIAGGRVRIIACGGAALDRKLAKAYFNLGLPVLQGYGLTEASPVVTCNSTDDNRIGTVGRPLDGVEVKIGLHDEVCVRGANVMRGYLHGPERTAEMVDTEGWLHTGDQGSLDADGHLIITGRIKDLIITSYGKNIAAAAIETRLRQSPHIGQAVVAGDGRKYLVALIVPSHDVSSEIIQREIDRVNEELAPFERIKAFRLIHEEFSQENSLLTPTLKPRRQAITERYRDILDSMYESETRALA